MKREIILSVLSNFGRKKKFKSKEIITGEFSNYRRTRNILGEFCEGSKSRLLVDSWLLAIYSQSFAPSISQPYLSYSLGQMTN